MKRILIAPLDWGLGHATRCIPLIRWFLRHDAKVFVAGSGPSLQLLLKEFPAIEWLELPGYNPRYPKDRAMVSAMAMQVSRFLAVMRAECRLVEQFVTAKAIDIVISDNRYGCRAKGALNIFITHQCNILMPAGFGWLAPIVRWLNLNYIRKFDTLWVPDDPEATLAGTLISCGEKLHRDIKFIGPLSRFTAEKDDQAPHYDIVAVCSGPEPQRSIFERILREQLDKIGKRSLLVRGDVNGKPILRSGDTVVDYLTSADLERVLKGADIVVARSGYSTLMDLNVLGKKAIFVPTPGQTEQEYLAKKLMTDRVAFSMDQQEFDLNKAISELEKYNGFSAAASNERLVQVLTELSKNEKIY